MKIYKQLMLVEYKIELEVRGEKKDSKPEQNQKELIVPLPGKRT